MYLEKKHKKLAGIIFTFLAVLVLSYLLKEQDKKNNPDIPDFVKNEYKKWTGYDLGTYTTYESVSKELTNDSIMFKIVLSNSEIRVVANGISFKKNGEWAYSYFTFDTFNHSVRLDSAKKYYLDGTLAPW